MTDRFSERDYINAKRFAESLDSNRLKDGISVIEQLPYYAEQMRLAGLNPNFPEHCKLAKKSLEDRLKAAGSEMIVRPSDELLVQEQDGFKTLFLNECRNTKDRLIELYHTYVKNGQKFGCSSDYFVSIRFNGSCLDLWMARYNEENRLRGNFFTEIKIKKALFSKKIKFITEYYPSCPIDFEQKLVYMFEREYENGSSEHQVNNFYLLFKKFCRMPEELELAINGMYEKDTIKKEKAKQDKQLAEQAKQQILKEIVSK